MAVGPEEHGAPEATMTTARTVMVAELLLADSGVQMERTYINKKGEREKEVKPEDRIKSYRYGKEQVPFSEEDLELDDEDEINERIRKAYADIPAEDVVEESVLRHEGFRFFFYSNEGDPREPVHVHVMRGGAETKLWLRPEVHVADSAGFDARTLRRVMEIAEAHREMIERAWDEHFG